MGSMPFMTENVFKVNFHGVRGSIPSPLTPEEVEEKLLRACQQAQPEDLKDENSIRDFVSGLPNEIKGTIGGNSSCVSLEVNGERLIFDAGSGIRMLGQDLMGC
jgi:phosphoribosyl 1,2-cyclic phosphodiesterase